MDNPAEENKELKLPQPARTRMLLLTEGMSYDSKLGKQRAPRRPGLEAAAKSAEEAGGRLLIFNLMSGVWPSPRQACSLVNATWALIVGKHQPANLVLDRAVYQPPPLKIVMLHKKPTITVPCHGVGIESWICLVGCHGHEIGF